MEKNVKQQKDLEKMRHSCEHVLTMAMMRLWPGRIKAAMGPAIEDGFYFDFDSDIKISKDNFGKIEKEMAKIINENLPIIKDEMTVKVARKFFSKNTYQGNEYKHEWINEIEARNEKISVYWMGKKNQDMPKTFVDICSGPHVSSTKKIGPFKLLSVAGAYWHGDEKNKMLQRIYGTCFNTQEELDNYLMMVEEAKKRDHRKLGKELKIFTFSDLVGQGLPLWLPNGAIIIDELEKLAKESERDAGYQMVKTPHIAKEEMYLTSGHLPYYKDSMYPPMILSEEDGTKATYYLKAMNCPHHHQIYAFEPKSYRDLPIRLAEYGSCYRYEKSGELFGLMRVRSMQMNDAHIYCTQEQFENEFNDVIKMYLKYFKIFGIKKYVMRLSTHSKEGLGKKYIDNEELWLKTEQMVRNAITKSKIEYVEVADEAAFYGPKIDVEVWSAIGKEFSLATNQVDFAVPERFGLKYIDKNGKEQTPICIHRAPLGTHERTIGFLIEHFAGAFPTWLSPIQAKILPVSEKFNKYGQKVKSELLLAGIRSELDVNNESLGKKIRQAQLEKVPYMLIVGEKETKVGKVAVRTRSGKDLGAINLKKFIQQINEEIEKKVNK